MSPLGLGSDPDDPKQYNLPQSEKNKLIRAQALGDALGMAAPPAAAGMMILPKIRGVRSNVELLNRKTVEATPDALKEVTSYFAQKFPRLMSHVREVGEIPNVPVIGVQYNNVPNTLGNVSSIHINPGTLRNRFDALETMGHELTHSAQAVRRADFNPLTGDYSADRLTKAYDALERLGGYEHNPFEKRARTAGLNQANRDLMEQRAAEGPLLPGIASRKNIKSWAEGVTKNTDLELQKAREQTAIAPMAKPHPDFPAWMTTMARKEQAANRLQTFGSSPAGKQGKLPFVDLPAEFELHARPQAASRPTFREPSAPTAEDMNRNPRAPKFSKPWEGGDSPDARAYRARWGDLTPDEQKRFLQLESDRVNKKITPSGQLEHKELTQRIYKYRNMGSVGDIQDLIDEQYGRPKPTLVVDNTKPKLSTGFSDDPTLHLKGVTEPLSFDISNLGESMGISRVKPGQVTIIQGDKPRVRIQRYDKQSRPSRVEEYEIPPEMADQLVRRSFQLERGVEQNAVGRKRQIGKKE